MADHSGECDLLLPLGLHSVEEAPRLIIASTITAFLIKGSAGLEN